MNKMSIGPTASHRSAIGGTARSLARLADKVDKLGRFPGIARFRRSVGLSKEAGDLTSGATTGFFPDRARRIEASGPFAAPQPNWPKIRRSVLKRAMAQTGERHERACCGPSQNHWPHPPEWCAPPPQHTGFRADRSRRKCDVRAALPP